MHITYCNGLMGLMSLLARLRPVCLAATRLIRSNISIQQWTYTTVHRTVGPQQPNPNYQPRCGFSSSSNLRASLSISFLPIITYLSVVRLGIMEGRGRHVTQCPYRHYCKARINRPFLR
ncbi:hypothetical protein V8E52_010598 [Russula decolorans]